MQKYKSSMENKLLSLEDLNQAEIQLIQYSQKQQFPEERFETAIFLLKEVVSCINWLCTSGWDTKSRW